MLRLYHPPKRTLCLVAGEKYTDMMTIGGQSCLSWNDNKQEVIGQLYKIIEQAFDLHRKREKGPEAQKRTRDESWRRWD